MHAHTDHNSNCPTPTSPWFSSASSLHTDLCFSWLSAAKKCHRCSGRKERCWRVWLMGIDRGLYMYFLDGGTTVHLLPTVHLACNVVVDLSALHLPKLELRNCTGQLMAICAGAGAWPLKLILFQQGLHHINWAEPGCPKPRPPCRGCAVYVKRLSADSRQTVYGLLHQFQ